MLLLATPATATVSRLAGFKQEAWDCDALSFDAHIDMFSDKGISRGKNENSLSSALGNR